MSSRQATSSSALTTGLFACAGLAAFYSVGYTLQSEFFQRYFCGHPLEYISAGMFFVGVSILALKCWRLTSETRALKDIRPLSADNESDVSPDEMCGRIDKSLHSTHMFGRIRDVARYLKGSRREGLEEHLRYLAELAGDRLHQTYATIRTITWAIPILGFLGTVIGITMAIANVTPEQLDTSLGTVTQGLSVAFDTTALALGLSIVLVFASFVVERGEQRVLAEVEQFGIDVLLPRYGVSGGAAETSQQQHLTAGLSAAQTALGAEQLAAVRTIWADALRQHAEELREAIAAELEQTMQQHREFSASARDTYAEALHHAADSVADRVGDAMNTFDQRVSAWQQALQTSSQDSARQSESLHELGALLLRLTESGGRISELQSQLNENLQALQVAETLERTANSLTAAVHVLTAKTSARHAA